MSSPAEVTYTIGSSADSSHLGSLCHCMCNVVVSRELNVQTAASEAHPESRGSISLNLAKP